MPTSSPEAAAGEQAPDGAPTDVRPTGWLNVAPDSRRAAPGLEWRIWRRLPWIALGGTALPLVVLALLHAILGSEGASAHDQRLLGLADYITLGVLALHWTLTLTVAIGCVIVMIMKGPHYTADSYRVPHRDRPAG